MEKTQTMRLSANLLHKLWQEIVRTTGYLYNQTLRVSNDWKSPYKAFHTYVFDQEGVSGPQKPHLHPLKVYSCKAYVLIKSKRDADRPGKRQKLDAKAHIGYLVGYKSTNIYRIWIPHKRKVISARDVIFDKDKVWDRKPIRLTSDKVQERDKAIEVVEIPQAEEQEDIQLAENLDLSNPTIIHQHDHEMENLDDKKQAEQDELDWARGQYSTPDFFEPEFARETNEINAFLTNRVENQHMTLKQGSAESSKSAFIADLADSADSTESKGVWSNQTSQPHHSHSHSHPQPHGDEPYLDFKTFKTLDPKAYIEPSILDELQNQRDQSFYDF